jgi:GTP cyclohydrolase II
MYVTGFSMATQRITSRLVLEVERAVGDLRRGYPVMLRENSGRCYQVSAGEYEPAADIMGDAAHPAVRLMKIAGLLPIAVLREIPTENIDDMLVVSEGAIVRYPDALATVLERVSDSRVPLKYARDAQIIAFRPRLGHEEHLAVVVGDIRGVEAPLVRVHSSCVTGDLFGSLRCDCGDQLRQAIRLMAEQGAGILVYLSQEGRGIGIANKLRAYRLQDNGMDTVEANEALGFAADERNFLLAATMLKELKVGKIRLITNNLRKIKAMTENGIEVTGRESLSIEANRYNQKYLETKAKKLGHVFDNA